MRYIDPTLKARIQSAQQTLYNNANPQMEVIAVRARTPITRKELWQELIITESATAVCTSVAVKKTGRTPETVYAAYVDSTGVLTVKSAAIKMPIRLMTWQVETTISDCVACAIEFDGYFVRVGQHTEYHTESTPWLFYVTTAGALYGGPLGGTYTILGESNVSAVSAVRGFRSTMGEYDQGLILFSIVSGDIYMRELIDDVWSDAAPIGFGPEVTWVELNTTLTWDYRIVIQAVDSSGVLYELYAHSDGIAKKNFEHIEITNLTATGQMYEVAYRDAQGIENIEIVDLSALAALLWAVDQYMIEAENIAVSLEDPENPGTYYDDYGYKVMVTWDHPVDILTGNGSAFTLTDSTLVAFGSTAVAQIDADTIEITFQNFNNAMGNCTIAYTPGTIQGEAQQTLLASSVVFTPTGLVPVAVDPPVPTGAVNTIDWSLT